VKLEYQLTRAIFFRYIGQVLRPGPGRAPRPAHRAADPREQFARGPAIVNDFRSDVLFSYKPTPGTVFFFGTARRWTSPTRSASAT